MPRFLTVFIFIFFCPAESLLAQDEPAAQWHLLYTQIRDGLISKQEAQARLRSLEAALRGLYPGEPGVKGEGPLFFPLEDFGPGAVGGKKGSGYKAQGYDFFDGNRHRGHPGHDVFIRDKDQDGRDDATGRPVYVVSASPGIVVSVNLGWQVSSGIRGGNYIWIDQPGKERYFYYAHLNEIFVRIGQWVTPGERMGTVGRTGKNANAMRSPTHLHFAVHQSAGGYPKPVNPYQELIKGDCRQKSP